MAVTFDNAQLVSVFVQCLVYGCFLVLFIGCLWALLFRRSTPHVNKLMLVTECLLFFLATWHLAVCWARARDAFIDSQAIPFGATVSFTKNIGGTKNVMKGAVVSTQTLIADSLLAYRCYVIWARNIWVIMLPSLMVIATATMGYLFTHEIAVAGTTYSTTSLLQPNYQRFFVAFFILTLCVNVILTSMIAFRIWSVERAARKLSGQSLLPAIIVLIESGALYCATIICIIALYYANSNVLLVVMDSAPQILGVTFSLIIIRVALGFSQGSDETTQEESAIVFSTRPIGLRSLAPTVASIDLEELADRGTPEWTLTKSASRRSSSRQFEQT